MCVYESLCWCNTLNGSKVIAFLGLINGLINVLYTCLYYDSVFGHSPRYEYYILDVTSSVLVVLNMISLIPNGQMIVGVLSRKPIYLKPWLGFYIIFLMYYTCVCVVWVAIFRIYFAEDFVVTVRNYRIISGGQEYGSSLVTLIFALILAASNAILYTLFDIVICAFNKIKGNNEANQQGLWSIIC